MHRSSLLLSLALATGTLAQDASYISSVCEPLNSSSYPDMNAPCNQVLAIQSQCLFGPSAGLSAFFGQFSFGSNPSTSNENTTLVRRASSNQSLPSEQSPSLQRDCMCSSPVFSAISGCISCQSSHGSHAVEAFYSPSFISSLRSAYCAASSTPSLGLADFLNSYVSASVPPSILSSASAASATPFSDPLGSRTQVSLYYTPGVTGAAAYVVAEETVSGSTGIAGLSTVSGQIVPTTGTAGGSAAEGTGVKKGGAGKREAAAMAGVLGFAGLVALL